VKVWLLSDLHLKTVNERNGNILLRFLHSLARGEREATHLVMLGDIFDFWVGDHGFYTKQFQPYIDAVLAVQKAGIKVIYFEGNHDVHVKKFWDSVGIETHVEDEYFQFGKLNVRLSHGDLINPNDHKYLKYREFIRRPLLEKLAHILPARELTMIGKVASRKSRKRSSHYRRHNEDQLIELIRTYAEKCFREKPFDILFTGHMHVRDDWVGNIDGRAFRSVNLGSWFDVPQVFWLTETASDWETVG